MSIETDFVAALDAYASLTTLVGTRISKSAVDQSAARPLVVFNAAHDLQHTLDGTPHATQAIFTVECWADSGNDAAAVADEVAAALATFDAVQTSAAVTVIARSSVYDGDLDLHGEVLTVEWWDT